MLVFTNAQVTLYIVVKYCGQYTSRRLTIEKKMLIILILWHLVIVYELHNPLQFGTIVLQDKLHIIWSGNELCSETYVINYIREYYISCLEVCIAYYFTLLM